VSQLDVHEVIHCFHINCFPQIILIAFICDDPLCEGVRVVVLASYGFGLVVGIPRLKVLHTWKINMGTDPRTSLPFRDWNRSGPLK
jgi:hypothetical protein